MNYFSQETCFDENLKGKSSLLLYAVILSPVSSLTVLSEFMDSSVIPNKISLNLGHCITHSAQRKDFYQLKTKVCS